MTDIEKSLDALLNRRRFLKNAGLGALGVAGAGLLSKSAEARTHPDNTDAFILNFALNLEYLEAQYYAHATTGMGLEALGIPLDGSDGSEEGPVIVKPTGSTQVPFQSDAIRQYAEEIAKDEESHVVFIRKSLAKLGLPYVAQPEIDLYNSFNALAKAAGLGDSFDPFASDINFLLGAYIFEDVGVTAYHGAAPLIFNKTVLNYAAGILAVEAYHAGLIRTKLFELGQGPATQAISNVRIELGGDSVDSNGKLVPPDYGVEQPVNGGTTSSIVLSDSNAIAFNRNVHQVLYIVYGNKTGAPGGFFPRRINLPYFYSTP